MLGFTSIVFEKVQNLRVTELKMSTSFRRFLSASVLFSMYAPCPIITIGELLLMHSPANNMRVLAPFVTFLVYALIRHDEKLNLTPATAFTGLSVIGMLSDPVNTMLRTIPTLKAAIACFDRIQEFLESPSRELFFLPLEESLKAKDESLSSSKQNITNIPSKYSSEDKHAIVKSSPAERSDPTSLIMEVRNASFAWTADDTPPIKDVSFSVQRKGFVFIIGPVGCGKSTLLKGLMSETPIFQGAMHRDSVTSAFVDQTPWIQNTTIRQNIIGPSPLNAAWYGEVVLACALDHDIAMMPDLHGMFATTQ